MKYILFTSPTCPQCPEAKEIMKEQNKIEGIDIDVVSNESIEMAREYEIFSVPTVVLVSSDNEKKVLKKWVGVTIIRAGINALI